jgi:hypothetical protein
MTIASVNAIGIWLCIVASTAPIWGDVLRAMPGPIGRGARRRRVRRMVAAGQRRQVTHPRFRPVPGAGILVVDATTGEGNRVGRHAA